MNDCYLIGVLTLFPILFQNSMVAIFLATEKFYHASSPIKKWHGQSAIQTQSLQIYGRKLNITMPIPTSRDETFAGSGFLSEL